MPILTAAPYKNNGELIAAVLELGYLKEGDIVYDATYGKGVFWKTVSNVFLVKNANQDFRHLPEQWFQVFDVVVFDGPYKLNGTPSVSDARYGVDIPDTWEGRIQLLREGMIGCFPVVKPGGYLFVKCMDQVARNHRRWQSVELIKLGEAMGLTLEDELLMQVRPRKQPGEGAKETRTPRPQRHTRMNFSNLLVFQKGI